MMRERIVSISAMRVYNDKSHEELRYEDYVLNFKGSFGGPPSAFSFGQPKPTPFSLPLTNFPFVPSTNFIPAPPSPFSSVPAKPQNNFRTIYDTRCIHIKWPTSVTGPATHGQNGINGQWNVPSNTVNMQPTNPFVQRTASDNNVRACFRVNVGSIDVDDVSSLIPKLPPGKEYYTEPSIEELEAKERAQPGFCSHVKEFVVGRKDKGSIKFLGETDSRRLDVESIVQFNDLEVVVYFDNSKKPPVGQGLNKPSEITLLNVKCVSKLTEKQYLDGPQLRRYEEKLTEKAEEIGAKFTSYDPVQGEWKFRVQHF